MTPNIAVRVRRIGRNYGAVLLAVLIGVTGAILGLGLLDAGATIFAYPLLVVALASTTFVALDATPAVSLPTLGPTRRTAFDALLFLLIPVLVVLGRGSYGLAGLPDVYYAAFVAFGMLAGVRVLFGHPLPVVFELALFVVVTRATVWTHAPVVGTDSRFHVALASYVVETGHVIPEAALYYHWYPFSHLLSAALAVTGGVDPRVATFLAVTGVAVVSIPAVYLLTDHVLADETAPTAPLFACLLVAVSPWHIYLSSLPVAQSLSGMLVPVVAYLFFRRWDRRLAGVVLLLLFGTVFTHNLTPLLLFGLGASILVAGEVVSAAGAVLDTDLGERVDSRGVRDGTLAVLLASTGSYFVYNQYVDYVAVRVLAIFSPESSLQSAVDNPVGGQMPTTTVLVQLDPILLFAGFVLVQGFLLTVVAYLLFDAVFRRRAESFPVELSVASTVFLLGFAAMLFLGQQYVVRSLPAVTFVLAPVCGYGLWRLVASRGIGPVVAVALVTAGAFFGVANPTANVTDRTEFKPIVVDSTEAAIDFASQRDEPVYADGYAAQTATFERWSRGVVGDDGSGLRTYQLPDELGSNTLVEFLADHPSGEFLFRTYLRQAEDVAVPACYARTYDSGSAILLSADPCSDDPTA